MAIPTLRRLKTSRVLALLCDTSLHLASIDCFVSFTDLDLVVALRRHKHRPVSLGRGPLHLRKSLLPRDAQVHDSLRSANKHGSNEITSPIILLCAFIERIDVRGFTPEPRTRPLVCGTISLLHNSTGCSMLFLKHTLTETLPSTNQHNSRRVRS